MATALHARGYRTGLFGKYAQRVTRTTSSASEPATYRRVGHVPDFRVGVRRLLRLQRSPTAAATAGRREDYSTDVLGAPGSQVRPPDHRRPAAVPDVHPVRAAQALPAGAPAPLPAGARPAVYHPPSVTEKVRDKPASSASRPRVPAAADRLHPHSPAGAAARRRRGGGRHPARVARDRPAGEHPAGLHVRQRPDDRRPPHARQGHALPFRDRCPAHHPLGRSRPSRCRRPSAGCHLDVTTTIARATGATDDDERPRPLRGRRATELLLEGRQWQQMDGSVPHPAYCGLRSARYLFVHWAGGFEELYDYRVDPFETQNRAADPAYAAVVEQMRDITRARCSPVPRGSAGRRPSPEGYRRGAPPCDRTQAALRRPRSR